MSSIRLEKDWCLALKCLHLGRMSSKCYRNKQRVSAVANEPRDTLCYGNMFQTRVSSHNGSHCDKLAIDELNWQHLRQPTCRGEKKDKPLGLVQTLRTISIGATLDYWIDGRSKVLRLTRHIYGLSLPSSCYDDMLENSWNLATVLTTPDCSIEQ